MLRLLRFGALAWLSIAGADGETPSQPVSAAAGLRTAARGLWTRVIAAVVVGGVAISGGRGTLVGPLLGVLLLATIGPALVFLGSQPYWEKTIQGAIILVAVATDSLARGRRSHA